ncbi:MAG: arginine decarboxylase [Maribacter sp.]|jgi:arginine decarboxylase
MKNTYLDLIEQTFDFPQEGFSLEDTNLIFNGIDLSEIIKTYGTPLRFTYLPSISSQINKAKELFNTAFLINNYTGKYHYCYCTKSSHFKFILDEVIKNNIHLETSSAFDMDIINQLISNGKINKKNKIICNGFKSKVYIDKIIQLINNKDIIIVPVLDNLDELDYYLKEIKKDKFDIGLRVATDEEPNFQFYTSRLGISHSKVISFYKEKIQNNEQVQLRMLHFFVDTGIKDSIYYWNEFKKCMKLYGELKNICPTLKAINIGGGLPIQNSLGFDYDYQYMINEIVSNIKSSCEQDGIPMPDIYTEFGTFTVGASGAHIFSVLGQKSQNDAELWYMIDNSLMNTLPDTWGIDKRFVILPINKWKHEYARVNVGGMTCDNSDYYNSEAHINQLYLPKYEQHKEAPLYIGFFNTGAYQENISGYGGIKHCLIPSPKHILIDKDENGNIKHWLHQKEQTSEDMLRILGY